jgi:hypothetical protein
MTIGVSVLLATVFAAGCNDRNAPTELSEEPAFDEAPFVVTQPFEFTTFNPCTGTVEDFFGTITLTVHFFQLEDPLRHHFNVLGRADLESASGFSGFAVGPDVDNGTLEPGAEDEEFSFTSIGNFNLSNDETGQRLMIHFNFHITIRKDKKGELVVRSLVDNFSARCAG